MKKLILVTTLMLSFLSFGLDAKAQNCKAIAEFTTYACNSLTEEACYSSANPAVCTVAGILAWDSSQWGNNLVQQGFEAGCYYTVKKTSRGYQVIINGAKAAVDQFLREFKQHIFKGSWQYYSGY